MDWIWQNRTWLFDGIGATVVIGLLLWLFKRLFPPHANSKAGNEAHALVGRDASFVASPIASGTHITQIINMAGAQNAQTASRLEFRSEPTPRDIFERIAVALPFDKERAAESYEGLGVRWRGRLSLVWTEGSSQGARNVLLRPEESGHQSQAILFSANVSEVPRLKIAGLLELLEVRGTINHIDEYGLVIRLKDVQIDFCETSRPAPAPPGPALNANLRTQAEGEISSREFGEVSFKFLPAGLLDNGWTPADPLVVASSRSFAPASWPGGLTREAKPEDAVDYALEKYQRVCNRLQFSARLADGAHVYAKVELAPKNDLKASRIGWIACDVGDRPPRKESGDEWVVFRTPRSDGWALFDLSLRDEVRRTFGEAEGLEFIQLLGIRLRGSLSVSAIKLYRDPPQL